MPTGSALLPMFRGHHVHAIDTKGRVSIPAGYRVEFQRRSDQAPILTTGDECLRLYPFDIWCEFEARIVGPAEIDPDAESFVRLMLTSADDCPIDKQGRILLPQRLREHAKLEREAVIAGMGRYVEIWERSLFEADVLRARAQVKELRRNLAPKLGH